MTAGKHVLCEKPLATNAADAREMADLARTKKLIGMVNLSYRNVAVLQKAAELVAGGAIGALRHFEASYLQSWLTQPAWGDWKTESQWLWRLSTAHGSKGVLGDVGIHILDFVIFAAGSPVSELSCRLKTFDKAEGGRIGEYTLDANDSATLQAELENGCARHDQCNEVCLRPSERPAPAPLWRQGRPGSAFRKGHRRPAHLPGRRSFFCDLD